MLAGACITLQVRYFGAAHAVQVSCRGASIEVVLPLSLNYVAFKTVHLSRQGNALRLVRIEESLPGDERDYSKARALLRAGRYEEGFAEWISASHDPNCVGMGCRPTVEALILQLVQEVAEFAKASFRARNLKAATGLAEAYFAFLGRRNVLPAGTAAAAAARLADLDELVPLVNDYAFYLAESNDYSRARPLLAAVIQAAPKRWVAHLNLADVLWAIAEQDEARKHYAIYAEQITPARWPKSLRERCASACAAR